MRGPDVQTPRVAARGVLKNGKILSTDNASVNAVDRRVNNCRQHLLISMAHECRGMRFTADHRPDRRQHEGFLGWAYFTAVGVPFDAVATQHFIAWCEPSFPKRTARVDCMAKLVTELSVWEMQP